MRRFFRRVWCVLLRHAPKSCRRCTNELERAAVRELAAGFQGVRSFDLLDPRISGGNVVAMFDHPDEEDFDDDDYPDAA